MTTMASTRSEYSAPAEPSSLVSSSNKSTYSPVSKATSSSFRGTIPYQRSSFTLFCWYAMSSCTGSKSSSTVIAPKLATFSYTPDSIPAITLCKDTNSSIAQPKDSSTVAAVGSIRKFLGLMGLSCTEKRCFSSTPTAVSPISAIGRIAGLNSVFSFSKTSPIPVP